MNRNVALAILLGALFVAAAGIGLVQFGSGEVVAQVQEGEPNLRVFALEPSATITPGQRTEVTLQVSNDGEVTSRASPDVRDELTTARNVRIKVDDDGTPIEVRTGQRSIGTVTEDTPQEVPILVEVPRDAEPGKYELDVTLRYRHSAQLNQDGVVTNDMGRTQTREIELEIDDGPLFALRNATTEAQVQDSGPMTVELENIGDETARDVSIALESSSARMRFGESQSEAASVSELEPGETTTLEYDLAFAEDASVRGYPLDATITYLDSDGIEGVDDYPETSVMPAARQSFSVSDVESSLQIGEGGTLRGTVTNTGPFTARSVVVQFAGESSAVSPLAPGGVALGTLEPGESTSFELPVGVDAGAEPVPWEIDLRIQYRNDENELRADDRPSANVTLGPEQRFAIEDIESTLRVGEDGHLTGTVTNAGPATARSVVVQFADELANVVPLETEVAVGTLEAGESASFRLPIEISEEAEPVLQTFDLAVKYRNSENEQRIYEEVDALAEIGESRDEFLLAVEDRQIQAGESILVEVEVTNNLDERVTDVEAKLFTDDPFDSSDDEGYIEALDPGESTTVTFELSAGSGAVPKTYPIALDFRYDDADGTSQVSDTFRVGIDVTSAEEGSTPWPLVGAVIVVLVVAAVVLYRRRSPGDGETGSILE